MNRKERRNKQQFLERNNKKYTDQMEEVPEHSWPEPLPDERARRVKVFRNKHFLVQLFEEGSQVRLSINRTQLGPDSRWKDNITWDELQKIKAMVGLGDQLAVEVYPRDRDVVNVANMRHLWLLNNETELGWKA